MGSPYSQPVPGRVRAGALEPVTGQVYFSPACHAGYEALGFASSPGQMGPVALPDGPAYWWPPGTGTA